MTSVFRWIRRAALLAAMAAAVRWVLTSKARHERARSGVVPTIGGDTWPPVPVNPVGRG